jgi:ABC-type hemin transport system ATPase subunit
LSTEPVLDQSGDGAAENFGFAIRGIKVGDQPMLGLDGPGSLTAVVGGNNVGKSTLLVQDSTGVVNISRGNLTDRLDTALQIRQTWLTTRGITQWFVNYQSAFMRIGVCQPTDRVELGGHPETHTGVHGPDMGQTRSTAAT